MSLKKNYSEKLVVFDNFSTKLLYLKILIPFYHKNPLLVLSSELDQAESRLIRQAFPKGNVASGF
jgi:hypothetical protein